MSRRSSLLRSFQSDAQLRQFFLDKVVPTGNELGIGSYGMVIEVEYNKKAYAAKKIHEILIQSGNEGIRDIIEKYKRECQLMASLQHPNITQFMGLCFLEGLQLPLLVMEKLEMSVDDLLECIPNIALSLKLSVLTDTCKGLEYLHDRKSPIVHRDLSARNVLLTSSLTAKIADLGNSRIVNFKPGQLAKTLSKNPGTTVYMPPEALNEIHRYGPSLDVFSFGHLTLYILTQIFPGELLSAAYSNPDNPDHIIGRSEVKRRATYMSMLESTYGLSYPELIEMVEHSLHNIPERRPLTKNLLSRLQDVRMKVYRSDGMNRMEEHYISSILYVKELKEENTKRIKEFEISLERLETDYLESMSTNERLEDEKREQYRLIETLQNEKEISESDRSKFEALASQLKGQLQQLESNLIDLKKQLEEKEQQLQHAHEELKRNTKSMDSVKSVESAKVLEQHANTIHILVTVPPPHPPLPNPSPHSKVSGTRGTAASTRTEPKVVTMAIDRRKTLGDLKTMLEAEVGVTSMDFRVFRVYSNNQEYEMFRLQDSLENVPNETRMVVRLGRALMPGEFRIKVFLLQINEVEFFKPLIDSIVAKNMTVLDLKQRIIKEAYQQDVDFPYTADRIRLRKKTWRSPCTVFMDSQVFERDIHVFANYEMFVEPLQGDDPMTEATQMQVYVRRWHPSSWSVERTCEIILEQSAPEHLKMKLAELSGVPQEHIQYAKAYGSFPCEMSVLEIENDLDWDTAVSSISTTPLTLYDDGRVVYYKDTREKLAKLSAEKRTQLHKQESERLNKYNMSTSSCSGQN